MPLPQVHGFQSGILSMYKIENQIFNTHQKYITQIPTSGSLLGLHTSQLISREKENQIIKFEENSLKNSIWLTNKLSTGQHLTKLDQNRAKVLQKSILATFYFGEKTIDINSTLQNDSQILSQINNAISVDLFQFLNQSSNRADTLDGYIDLLEILLNKTDKRIIDLQSKINFLKTNFSLKEQRIKLSEDVFFENLKMFDGSEAEKDLAQFIGLQESQVEVRAKIGTYETLQGYYKFFQPKLNNLIKAIKVNRGPLIAGVKVIEIQNMSLPLIIKQR